MEELCRAISPRLVGALLLQCKDRALAEDLAQEALARAWEHRHKVSMMQDPEGWVFRVAFNLNASRWRRVRVARAAKLARTSGQDPGGQGELIERMVVLDALQALTPRQRAVVVCRYYLDLSVGQTAEILDCAEGTVRALAHQGRERLRVLMASDVDPEVVPDGR